LVGPSFVISFFLLFITEPVTHIEGLNGRGPELFIKAGSTINLTCIVSDATENAPKHILWRHNSRVSPDNFRSQAFFAEITGPCENARRIQRLYKDQRCPYCPSSSGDMTI